jgi:hypothetical protein
MGRNTMKINFNSSHLVLIFLPIHSALAIPPTGIPFVVPIPGRPCLWPFCGLHSPKKGA